MHQVLVGTDNVLPRSSISTPVRILALSSRRWRRSKGFPRDFGSFLTRQSEIAVVTPEVGSVFAAVDEDAAGPCCSDACVDWSGSGYAEGGKGREWKGHSRTERNGIAQ